MPRLSRRPIDFPALARRLAHFWVVWSALLVVHEAGHALSAWRQRLGVRRVTIGVGPVLWRARLRDTEAVLRLVPLAGVTNVGIPRAGAAGSGGSTGSGNWTAWRRELATLVGGVLATLALAIGLAVVVLLGERGTRTRWRWGRIVVADALVLTVFNLLPVPPLDGGRAVVGAVAAWHGAALPPDVLFWVQLGGLALAVVPMMLWTRWTARIDAAALWWRAPVTPR